MRTKEIKVYNLPKNYNVTIDVDAKPTGFLSLGCLAGILLIIFEKYIYGGVLIIFCLSLLSFMPRCVLLEFSDDFFIIYDQINKNDCKMVYYSDIVYWTYEWGLLRDYLLFELSDGSIEKVECFGRYKIEGFLNTHARGKQKRIA